jgi:predicted dehydrogenase
VSRGQSALGGAEAGEDRPLARHPRHSAVGNGRAVAVASRSPGAAADTARALGVPRSYGGYQALLEDREAVAVYLPLPNALHREWTFHAAEAGKHVLYEKTLAVSRREASETRPGRRWDERRDVTSSTGAAAEERRP